MRVEDDLSNPQMPWCFGLTLDSMNIFTTNDGWERDHVTGEDISKKCIRLENFGMFVDWGDSSDKIFFDGLTKEDVDLDSLDP